MQNREQKCSKLAPVFYDSEIKMTSVKPEMKAVFRLPQFQNSETGILYCTVCTMSVVILPKLPVLHKSKYRTLFNRTRKLHELQVESAVTLL